MNAQVPMAPQTIEIKWPERPKATMKKVRLAGRSVTKLHSTDSIGYLNGKIPHVFIRIKGHWYRLSFGQRMSTHNAHDLAVFNPFQRTAEVDLLLNCGIGAPMSTLTRETEDFVNYRSQIINDVDENDKDKKGLGFMVTKGEYRVYLDRQTYYQMMILPEVQDSFLGLKPAGFMPTGFDVRYDLGSVLDGFIGIKGSYSEAELAQWIADTGYDLSNAIYPTEDTGGVSITLVPGMAVFCVTNSTSKVRVDVAVTDSGALGDVNNG